MTSPPAIWFHTFGCKANQYDTERIRQELESRGARIARSPAEAGVAILNTCTVTHQADAEARRLVRRLRRRHPELRIVVAGCSAAVRTAVYETMPEVDAVVPGQDPERVMAALRGPGLFRSGVTWRDEEAVFARATGSSVRERVRAARRGTRAWLKIQDGCDRKCSFCATRLARGSSRSRSPEEIVREARALALHHPEIVLTGIHIGHYGRDLPGSPGLGGLVRRLLEAVPGPRFRLGSIEATEIDDVLLALLTTAGGRLAPHLHVPLQSGSDAVLRRMRRWHTRDAYRRRVLEIAGRLPVLGLGADVIVGFPGEGEAEFAETRALIEELPYTYLHVFPFSPRTDTVAATLPDRVPPTVVAERSRILRELGHRKGAAYRASRVGAWAEVVVEGETRVTSGLTEDYLRVEVRDPSARPGDRIRVRLRGDEEGLWVAQAPAGDPRERGPASDSPPSTTKMAPVIQSPAGDAR